jgi:hypothetical protein
MNEEQESACSRATREEGWAEPSERIVTETGRFIVLSIHLRK